MKVGFLISHTVEMGESLKEVKNLKKKSKFKKTGKNRIFFQNFNRKLNATNQDCKSAHVAVVVVHMVVVVD